MADNKFLAWDAEIEQDSQEFIILPEGDYSFMVQGVEKTIYDGPSEKIGRGCPMVTLKIVVNSPQGNASIQEKLYLTSNMEWKLSAFFRSIGLKKHGQKFKMNFDAAMGKEGLCHIKQEKWTGNDGNERISNRIEKYLDPVPTAASQAPTAPSMPFEV